MMPPSFACPYCGDDRFVITANRQGLSDAEEWLFNNKCGNCGQWSVHDAAMGTQNQLTDPNDPNSAEVID